MSGRYTWRLRLECGHSIIWGPHDNEGNRREAGQIAECEICPNPALAERKIVEVNNVKTMLTLNNPATGEVIRLDKGDAVTLIDRLNAALDEDERDAREAILPGGSHGNWSYADRRITDDLAVLMVGHIPATRGRHIARHDPARVLRQVEGARKILALHDIQVDDFEFEGHQKQGVWCASCNEAGYCPTVLALAEMFGVEP